MGQKLIGIDIGGTKISVSIGDCTGTIYAGKRIATKKARNWREGCSFIKEMVTSLLHEEGLDLQDIEGVGISAPGPLSVEKGKLLELPNLPTWKNAPVVEELKKSFSCPLFFNNDANAQALAEYSFGAFRGTKNLVYLTCSTGMGGGIIVDGNILQGGSDTAGEIGHFVLDINGPDCPCSQKGCFEIYCGGANLRKRVQETLRKYPRKTLVLEEAGGDITAIDFIHIEKALRKKDAFAREIWDEFTTRLAQGLGIILMTLNPEVVILGTIAIHMEELLMPELHEKLPKYCWKMPRETCPIHVSSLGKKISELAGIALACQNRNKRCRL